MKKIILASASPRRKELLSQLGLSPEIQASEIVELSSPEESPESVAMSLAFQKAIDVASKFQDGVVVAADTIVVLEGKIMGKPFDKADAYEMLRSLSGRTHDVITGFSIVDTMTGIKIVDYEKTLVRFRNLDKERIIKYIESGEALDKAGSYGIQGKGALLVDKIEGCYFNVVGLPLSKLEGYLKTYFGINLL